MSDLYKNIRARRLALKMSQQELADLVGYEDRTSIAKIEAEKVDLGQSKILAFAKALRIDPVELMGLGNSRTHKRAVHGVKIPVLGDVAAGVPIDAIQNYIDEEEIDADLAGTGDFFGLRIHGDSMAPRILDGDVVIVRSQPDANTGDLIIAQINGERATCKRLIKHEDSITLMSFNPAYQPVTFTKEEISQKPVQIIGKVIELRGKF